MQCQGYFLKVPWGRGWVSVGDLRRARVKAGENFQCGKKYENAGVTRQMRVTWYV